MMIRTGKRFSSQAFRNHGKVRKSAYRFRRILYLQKARLSNPPLLYWTNRPYLICAFFEFRIYFLLFTRRQMFCPRNDLKNAPAFCLTSLCAHFS